MKHIEILRHLHENLLMLHDVSVCYVVCFFSWLSVGWPTGSQQKSTKRTSALYIQYTSWCWDTNRPETCRFWV